ncbi:MAG: hypothetical protein KDK41_02925 [Leptospiraceae bacterium]|nr:hypothetical protein [Leptospiraceae bacterium]MCB1199574.1 hypothetical protein [Leptospiraceae bacterium]
MNLLDAIRKEQVARLKETYRDFIESEQYSAVTDYFFDQIYDTQYKDKRDEAFTQLHEKMMAVVGEKRIKRVSQLKELNDLTDELDLDLTNLYAEKFPGQKVEREKYEKCYYWQNRKAEREHQINLLHETTMFFHKLAHIPFLGFVIKPTKLAAKAMGIEHLMDFFMRGYNAFKSVKDASPFLDAVRDREFAYLNALESRFGKEPS